MLEPANVFFLEGRAVGWLALAFARIRPRWEAREAARAKIAWAEGGQSRGFVVAFPGPLCFDTHPFHLQQNQS